MQVIVIVLIIIWAIGAERIGRRHSRETLSSLFGFKPAETTLKGWFYLILWGGLMLFLIGLVGLAAGH